jgi:SpoVK/Ycf46/Vps4 family AAA+-type ATPase
LKNEALAENFDFEIVGNITEGFSGSDLSALCVDAARAPIRDLIEKKTDSLEVENLRSLVTNDFVSSVKRNFSAKTKKTAMFMKG